ncbi:MAG: hypothetical protein N0C86_11150, partial [Candidatus Thiodiazotropha taylori]|nr:hypothetical protein [Candidatus Thiodiazotropha taylori]MCW4326542.1 hypothetical protein [Candidatus Thiodiazotropha taylori]
KPPGVELRAAFFIWTTIFDCYRTIDPSTNESEALSLKSIVPPVFCLDRLGVILFSLYFL